MVRPSSRALFGATWATEEHKWDAFRGRTASGGRGSPRDNIYKGRHTGLGDDLVHGLNGVWKAHTKRTESREASKCEATGIDWLLIEGLRQSKATTVNLQSRGGALYVASRYTSIHGSKPTVITRASSSPDLNATRV